MASAGAIRAGQAYIELSLDDKNLTSQMASVQRRVGAFARGLQVKLGVKFLRNGVERLGKSMQKIGRRAALLGAGGALGLGKALGSYGDFDYKMRFASSLAQVGIGSKESDALSRKALQLGRSTTFTAQQVAESMVSLGRQGLRFRQIMGTIRHALDLAVATDTPADFAAEAMINTRNAFQMPLDQIQTIADVLGVTANGSAQTLTHLAESLSKVSAQAGAAKDDFRSVAASLGVLANLGIRGEIAGTALRNAYLRMSHPEIREMLQNLPGGGVKTLDENGDLRSMVYIMRDLSRVMGRLSSSDRILMAEKIFDIRGSLSGLQLTTHAGAVEEFLAKVGYKEDDEELRTAYNRDVRNATLSGDVYKRALARLSFGGDVGRMEASMGGAAAGMDAAAWRETLLQAFKGDREEMDKYLLRNRTLLSLVRAAADIKGSNANLANQLMQGPRGMKQKIWSAAENVNITFGKALWEEFEPVTRGIVGSLQFVSEWIGSNHRRVRDIVLEVGKGIAATVALGGAAKGVSMAWSGVSFILSSIHALLLVLFNPLGLAAAAVVALGVRMGGLSGAFKRFGTVSSHVWDTFVGLIGSGDFARAFGLALKGAMALFKSFMLSLRASWDNFRNYISDVLKIRRMEKSGNRTSRELDFLMKMQGALRDAKGDPREPMRRMREELSAARSRAEGEKAALAMTPGMPAGYVVAANAMIDRETDERTGRYAEALDRVIRAGDAAARPEDAGRRMGEELRRVMDDWRGSGLLSGGYDPEKDPQEQRNRAYDAEMRRIMREFDKRLAEVKKWKVPREEKSKDENLSGETKEPGRKSKEPRLELPADLLGKAAKAAARPMQVIGGWGDEIRRIHMQGFVSSLGPLVDSLTAERADKRRIADNTGRSASSLDKILDHVMSGGMVFE